MIFHILKSAEAHFSIPVIVNLIFTFVTNQSNDSRYLIIRQGQDPHATIIMF